MDRAEIWWANFAPPVGRRPVVIVTRSAAVPLRDQVVVAQVTRTVRGLMSEVPLTRADGMPLDCVINCDTLLTVPKSRLEARIAALSPNKIEQLHGALRFALGLP